MTDIRSHASSSGGSFSPRGLKLRHLFSQQRGAQILHLAWTSDGRQLLTGSSDGTLKVWDIESSTEQTIFSSRAGMVCGIAICPDSKHVVSAFSNNTLEIWNIKTASLTRTLQGHAASVRATAVTPDGQLILSVSEDSSLKIWETSTGKSIHTLTGHSQQITALAITPDGRTAITASHDDTLHLWEIEKGQHMLTISGHTNDVNGVSVMPDGKTIVSSSYDHTLRFWDLNSGRLKHTQEFAEDALLSVTINSDGTLLAVKSLYGRVIISKARPSRALISVNDGAHNWAFHRALAFSPTGSLLATTARGARDVAIWEINSNDLSDDFTSQLQYSCAKVVLLGESGVGKTALANRLVHNKYVPTQSTHGMNIWRLDLPLQLRDAPGLEREAWLWDLAGQADYRLVHSLFLDQTSLAMILFDPVKDDPYADIDYWEQVIRLATKNNPPVILLVAARVDRGTARLSDLDIRTLVKKKGFSGYLPTSSKTGLNCSKDNDFLKLWMMSFIRWEDLASSTTTTTLFKIKNLLLDVIANEDTVLMRIPELVSRLQSRLPGVTFGETEIRGVVDLLANHGIFLPLAFGGLVLLRPEEMNKYASAILMAARGHSDGLGVVAEGIATQGGIQVPDAHPITPGDQELLLRAVVHTLIDKSLCIAEDTAEGRQLTFPSQFSRVSVFRKKREIVASFDFQGDSRLVYTTLVVRLWYSGIFKKRELWHNTAEFAVTANDSLGIILEDEDPNSARLSIFFKSSVSKEMRSIFLEYIYRHIQKHTGKIKTVCDNVEWKPGESTLQVLTMDRTAAITLDNQAKEQILLGHMFAICGEANQIFRPTTFFDYGIDAEIEFKHDNGLPSGRKIFVQMKSGASHLRERRLDGKLVFHIKNSRHLNYWQEQLGDVYLVVRDGAGIIRWMNLSEELLMKRGRQLVFEGEVLDSRAVLRARMRYLHLG